MDEFKWAYYGSKVYSSFLSPLDHWDIVTTSIKVEKLSPVLYNILSRCDGVTENRQLIKMTQKCHKQKKCL